MIRLKEYHEKCVSELLSRKPESKIREILEDMFEFGYQKGLQRGIYMERKHPNCNGEGEE